MTTFYIPVTFPTQVSKIGYFVGIFPLLKAVKWNDMMNIKMAFKYPLFSFAYLAGVIFSFCYFLAYSLPVLSTICFFVFLSLFWRNPVSWSGLFCAKFRTALSRTKSIWSTFPIFKLSIAPLASKNTPFRLITLIKSTAFMRAISCTTISCPEFFLALKASLNYSFVFMVAFAGAVFGVAVSILFVCEFFAARLTRKIMIKHFYISCDIFLKKVNGLLLRIVALSAGSYPTQAQLNYTTQLTLT